MTKTFRVRCTLLEGRYVDPDIMEVYNVDDPSECYPTGRRQFRIGDFLSEDDFYLENEGSITEQYLVAYNKRVGRLNY